MLKINVINVIIEPITIAADIILRREIPRLCNAFTSLLEDSFEKAIKHPNSVAIGKDITR